MHEISRVKEARFYLEADLEWLTMQLNDERAKDFQAWVDKLDFGVPKNLAAEIAAYQAQTAPSFDTLIALRDKLKAELDGVDSTISATRIAVTEEVQKYLPKEETREEEVVRK